MALNVTTAVIGSGCNTATATPSLAQWDVGQVLKIEGVDLPAAYQVEFSTEYTRNAIPRIGNAAGVAIPNELLQRSAPIMAYIVLHEGENDRETEYWITIHITPRTPPETITPDPEEQSIIDETIAALQAGVAAAEAAAESVQNMGVEAETLTPGSPLTVTKEVDPETGAVTLIFGLTQGPKGDNGYSPTITITEIPGGHRFTVTDAIHPSGQCFDVLDGTKGDQGDDGYSPVVTITEIPGGHRFTVTDKAHPSGQSFDVLDGTKGDQGDDGYSPVVTITEIPGGHRVTITDKTHPSGQTFDVMDGVIQSVNGKSAASITLDSGDIEFDDSETYAAGSIGAEVSNQKNAISQLDTEVDAIEKIAVSEVDTSGSVIYIENGIQGAPINLKKLTIEATQSGSGTPSPTNKREFTGGYQSVNFYVSPTEDQEDATVQQFDLPAGAGTVYRGIIDFEAKKVTVKSVHKKLVGNGSEGISAYNSSRWRVAAPGFNSSTTNLVADILRTYAKAGLSNYGISPSDWGRQEVLIKITNSESTIDSVNEWLQENNVEFDYPLASPLEYTFDEIPRLAMLAGDNYVWSDAGEIELSYLIEKIVTDIETDQCTFFEDQSYTNVYNPNDPDILINYQIQASDNITAYNGLKVSGYIPCSAGETFMFPVYTSHFGTGSAVYTISMYDSNKTFLANVVGTLANDILTITIPSGSTAKYFRVNVCTFNVNSSLIETQYHSASNFMVIKGTTFPDRFYPYEPQVLMDAEIYSSHENLSNPLYTKRVVFLGDSICEGDSQSGWAGRIGLDNTMLWVNEGIGGSTISTVYAGKAICTRNIIMSNPDYIIFEGGTNDADRIGDATGETKPAAFGTWSESNYGTNDASTYYGFAIDTFCGAVDYLCKRLISDYAGAKIGFIGAHKMGQADNSRANRGYYIHTAMEICKKWGVPVLNLWDNCYLNPLIPAHYTSGQSYMYTDGQHLTANGYAYVSPIIEAWMKTL